MNRRRWRERGARESSDLLQASLAQIDALVEAEQYAQAMQLLQELSARYAEEPEVLLRLLDLAILSEDAEAVLAVAEPLTRMRPDDPEIALNLSIARLKTRRLALAWQSFAAFATRWPAHEHAAQAREQADELHELLGLLWAELDLAGPPQPELLAQHEAIQDLIDRGAWQEATQIAQQALRKHPGFSAIRNNLSLAYQNLGQTDRALAETRHVLAGDPQNLHAIGNLTRLLLLSGQLDEAARWASRLKALPTTSVAVAVKQAEALSFLGDDVGVLEAFDQVQRQRDRDDDPAASAMLHHLAAVAALRQGRTLAARRRWQKALELLPSLELAAENLADLDRPVDERHTPWPYSLQYWLPRTAVDALMRELDLEHARSEEAVTRSARRFVQRHPAVAAIVPALLDRGDPVGREFALRLAGLAQTPELLEALRTFALGQRGPTEQRIVAAQLVQRGGLLPSGMVRFWQGGAWQETMMLGFEISGEPLPGSLPASLAALQRDAALALRSGNVSEAERLLKQALAQAPGDPGLLNNLGAVYAHLGRAAEAEAIARQLHEAHPDYLFGRTNLVGYLIGEGKLEEAQALIDPLLRRPKLHFSEFSALMGAQVGILIAQGDLKAAQSWLDLWSQIDPDNGHIASYQARLRLARQRPRAGR